MPAIQVFIDTNVFLNFYSFPDDESAALDELVDLIGPDKINLHLPAQVENEFERNRESKLHAAVVDFKNGKMPTSIPNHMRGTETAKQYVDALKNAEHAKKALIGNVIGLAFQRELDVDLQIAKVFSVATKHEECDDALNRAVVRMQRGNPPGKSGNVGDRYNWETLIAEAPDDDLYIVTKDGDFTSPLGGLDKSMRPMAFLAKEWAARKAGASIYIYSSIHDIVEHYKKLDAQPAAGEGDIEAINSKVQGALPVSCESVELAEVPTLHNAEDDAGTAVKTKAISSLRDSESFAQTHRAVERLSILRPLLTTADAEVLFKAAIDNQQIKWIIKDTDVYNFYVKILTDHSANADPELADEMIDLLGLDQTEDENEADLGD